MTLKPAFYKQKHKHNASENEAQNIVKKFEYICDLVLYITLSVRFTVYLEL